MRTTTKSGAGRLLPLAPVIFLCACSSNAYKVASLQNELDFRTNRYNEQCPQAPSHAPAWCGPYYTDLLTAQRHAHEAAKALASKGSMKLQMGLLESDLKGLVR